MEIDRRTLLIGATATVAATALPALAARLRGARIYYRDLVNFPIIDRKEAWIGEGFSRDIELTSLWHLDFSFDDALIRHVITGYTYRRAESDDRRALRAVCIERKSRTKPDVDAIQLIGRAAYFACSYGACVLRQRPQHKGPVFLRYVRKGSKNPYLNPETSDAPRIRFAGAMPGTRRILWPQTRPVPFSPAPAGSC